MSDIQKANSLEDGFGEVIFVISGKGGVGKSTVAANLALGLKEKGHTVGILDADLHGPSQSEMFNLFSPPKAVDGKMIPPEQYGVKVMSAGMFGDKAKPFVSMFSTLKLPILSVVENMSSYECPHCHVPSKIFHGDGGGKLSREFNVQNLIEVPISSSLSLSGDNGRPLLASTSIDESQKHVVESLHKLVDKISLKAG